MACKNIDAAKNFLKEVRELAEKYDANYFIVSDGATSVNNKGNETVKYIHNCFKELEKQKGW